MSEVLQHLGRAGFLQDTAEWTDGQLLERFVSLRDEAALAALVRRHAPLVWGVCRRVLANYHDAEDAFQATFLVLVRKAASIASRELLANWLYGVAHQTALNARAAAARRRTRETQVTPMPEPALEQVPWDDLQPLLDRELSRLPDKYRAVLVLCDLEGKTRKEVAGQLGVPEGTVASRLATARATLARRLARHGLSVAGGALAALLSENVGSAGAPASLVSSTIQAASLFAAGRAAPGMISAKVAALTKGVLQSMLLTKLKTATAVLLVLTLAGTGVAFHAYRWVVGQPAQAAQEEPAPPGSGQRPEPGVPRAARAADGKTKQGKPATEPGEAAFENAPGWSWCETPRPRRELGTHGAMSNISGAGYCYIFDEDKDGALLVYLSFAAGKSIVVYRPVVFDAGRKRYLPEPTGSSGSHNVRLARFRLDPKTLATRKAVYLGIEMLTAAGMKVQAKDAADRARAAGVEVLPFPEVGAVYDFTLTALDGKAIRGKDLRGKVVLIDCWATWCSPCMAKMPLLRDLYGKYRNDGLEIVGVCFDQEANKARKAIRTGGLTWPQVLVPAEEKTRELWDKAAGMEGLPRLLLLDRSGVLRADCGPGELEDQISKLLQEDPKPTRKP
jgi:RNA polymerase sigma factor (sigma-70 family)